MNRMLTAAMVMMTAVEVRGETRARVDVYVQGGQYVDLLTVGRAR